MTASSRYQLGGVTPVPWLSRGKVAALGMLAVVGVAMMVVVIQWPNVIVAAVLVLTVVLFIVVARRRGSDGGLKVLGAGERLRHAIGRRARWDDFDPDTDDQPWLLMEPLRVVGVPAGDGTELAVLQYPTAMVSILKVTGKPHGVKPAAETLRGEQQQIALHRALADPGLCLEQLDWITLVRPESEDRVGEGFLDALDPDLAGPVGASAEELPGRLAAKAERLHTYAVLRFSTEALFNRVATPPFTASSGAEAAYDATSRVARMLAGRDVQVLGGLGPGQAAALVRAVLSPDRDPDDVTGCGDGFWGSCPSWRRVGGHVVTSSGWHHASAGFGLDDWPITPVQGRWLEPVVFGGHLGPRTIVCQVRLVPRWQARAFSKDQLTTAASKRHRKDTTGEIDAGEAWSKESAARQVAHDVVLEGHVGIMPSIRVLLSAPTKRQLATAMEALNNTVTDRLNAESLSLDDTRPGVGLLHCLPLGMEVPRR